MNTTAAKTLDLPRAACRGQAVVFDYTTGRAGIGDGRPLQDDVDAAKRICASCAEREPCLVEGLSHDAWGVWGGYSRPELQAMRERLRLGTDGLRASAATTALAPPGKPYADRMLDRRIRTWARDNGWKVPYRGPIPGAVRLAWNAAQSDTPGGSS